MCKINNVLTHDEYERFMHVLNTGDNLPNRFLSQEISQGNRYRNQSIIRLLLITDLKVSEIVSLNKSNVSLSSSTIHIKRNTKKNNKTIIFDIDEETMNCIRANIKMQNVLGVPCDENALFVLSQGKNKHKRITSQTINSLIMKYANAAHIDSSKLSPSKLKFIGDTYFDK